jgi:hypothetical protein
MPNELKPIMPVLMVDGCLRDEYTAYIIGKLIENHCSVNLVGKRSTGKSRLLEDIRDNELPGINIVMVNLKEYAADIHGLLHDIYRQLNRTGEAPGKFTQFLEEPDNITGQYVFLFDNYDVLLENPGIDPDYDESFFNALNDLIKKDNISMICTTRRVHREQMVYVDREPCRNSWLNLEIEELPELGRREISRELDRRMEEEERWWFQANPDLKSILLDFIHGHDRPYSRLQHLTMQIGIHRDEVRTPKTSRFIRQVKKWMKQFDKLNKETN